MHPKNNDYISFVEKSNPAHLIPLIFCSEYTTSNHLLPTATTRQTLQTTTGNKNKNYNYVYVFYQFLHFKNTINYIFKNHWLWITPMKIITYTLSLSLENIQSRKFFSPVNKVTTEI